MGTWATEAVLAVLRCSFCMHACTSAPLLLTQRVATSSLETSGHPQAGMQLILDTSQATHICIVNKTTQVTPKANKERDLGFWPDQDMLHAVAHHLLHSISSSVNAVSRLLDQ